jgi:hypothetical protein
MVSRRIRSDFLPRLRAETTALIRRPNFWLKALVRKQSKADTTACRQAAEVVRRPDKEANARLPVCRGIFQQSDREGSGLQNQMDFLRLIISEKPDPNRIAHLD